jgi:hypothetical protein
MIDPASIPVCSWRIPAGATFAILRWTGEFTYLSITGTGRGQAKSSRHGVAPPAGRRTMKLRQLKFASSKDSTRLDVKKCRAQRAMPAIDVITDFAGESAGAPTPFSIRSLVVASGQARAPPSPKLADVD